MASKMRNWWRRQGWIENGHGSIGCKHCSGEGEEEHDNTPSSTVLCLTHRQTNPTIPPTYEN